MAWWVEELGDGDEAVLDKIEEDVNTIESIRAWCRCDVFFNSPRCNAFLSCIWAQKSDRRKRKSLQMGVWCKSTWKSGAKKPIESSSAIADVPLAPSWRWGDDTSYVHFLGTHSTLPSLLNWFNLENTGRHFCCPFPDATGGIDDS